MFRLDSKYLCILKSSKTVLEHLASARTMKYKGAIIIGVFL